jgi:calcium channel MID1
VSKRATTLYLTLNTCIQPSANSTDDSAVGGPPQLQIYVSQAESLQKPGPDTDSPDQTVFNADGGYVAMTLAADGNVNIGVSAPNSTAFSGIYNYEIAASIDAPYHEIDDGTPNLYFVDGDSGAALLVTNDTTQSNPDEELYKQWMNMTPPFTMFAHNMNDSAILGVHKSVCGLNIFAQISKRTSNVEAGMTNRGVNQKPKEQFYITSLNHSSTYYGFLAMEGNSTSSGEGVVGGGGKVWKAMNFTTKSGMRSEQSHNNQNSN